MLRVFESFAGIGSQRMALRNLGIEHEVVGIAEIDIDAIISYAAICGVDLNKDVTMMDNIMHKLKKMNVGFDFKNRKSRLDRLSSFKKKQIANANEGIKNFGDISKIDPHTLPDMDLFTYSFPCQDLSVAGKQRGMGEGTRSGLLYECEKVIEAKRPKYLLLENVKNLVGKKFKNEFDEWLKYLEGLGYSNYWKVLNAKDYGVPQNRERVFVVSILNSKGYEFPKPIKLDKAIRDILEDEVDAKYYMNKPFKLVDRGIIKAEFTEINFDQTKRIHGIDGHFQALAAADRGINNILVKAELTCYNNNQIKRVMGSNGICSTLDTMQGGHREPKILEGFRVRKLTPLECWRLMSFTDKDFYKAKEVGISNSQLYKQAGNSIVVKVLEGIFANLFLAETKENILIDFEPKKLGSQEVDQLKWII